MAPKIAVGLFSILLLLFLLLTVMPGVRAQAVSSLDIASRIPSLTTVQPSGNSPSQLAAASAATLAATSVAGSTLACTTYNDAYQGLSQGLSALSSAVGAGGLVSLALSYCQATTYNAKGFIDVPTPGVSTSGSTASSIISSLQSLTGQQTVSPTTAVNATNAKNAPYFLTCPNTPPSSPQTTAILIYPQNGSFVGGDSCLNSVGGIPTVVTLNTQIKNPPIGFGIPTTALPLAKITPLQVTNPGLLSTTDFVYTPEVDGILSNGFSTNSYIFQGVPSYAQHAIWSWSGPFANFGAIPAQSSSSSAPGTYLYVSYPNDVPDPFAGSCWIDYTYNEKTSLDWVHNVNLQFTYQSGTNATGTPITSSLGTPIFPYLSFNFNITTNAMTQGTLPNLSTLSYGVFTPTTYTSPYNSIETYPIDVPSELLVNTQVAQSQSQSIWQKLKSLVGLSGTPTCIP